MFENLAEDLPGQAWKLLDMTKYIKSRYPDEWKDKTLEYNKKFFEPVGKGMSFSEVSNVIGSREKRDYKYRCDQDWLKTYCNREECVKRKLGIGGGIDNELVLGPLSFVTSSPKIWYLGFNGDEVRLYSKELVKLLSNLCPPGMIFLFVSATSR